MEKINEYYRLLKKLVKNDLKSRYSGSVLGIVWAFIQPLFTILVFWYVFQIGFRNPPVENIQYILWFIAGYIPWIFFNDGVMSSSNVLYEYSFLVKKMKFKVWQLPMIKVLSSLYIHSFFIIFIIGTYFLYGHTARWSWLCMLYYSLYICVLLIGVSYFVSSLSVFIKDAAQMVNIILQVLFWMTPIFWSSSSMGDKVLKVLKLNPMYYAVNGYREALIDGVGFWSQSLKATVYYWGVAFVSVIIGMAVFKRLKVHFADLL